VIEGAGSAVTMGSGGKEGDGMAGIVKSTTRISSVGQVGDLAT